jgi:hypothetical protein
MDMSLLGAAHVGNREENAFHFRQWLRVTKSFSRYSGNGAAGWNFSEDNGPGAHHRLLAHLSAWEYDCAESKMRKRPDVHPTAEYRAGRDVNVGADPAIVLDDRSAVNDAVFADDGAGVDYGERHDDGSGSDARRRRNGGGWVNEGCGQEPECNGLLKTLGTPAVVADRNNKGASGKVL